MLKLLKRRDPLLDILFQAATAVLLTVGSVALYVGNRFWIYL